MANNNSKILVTSNSLINSFRETMSKDKDYEMRNEAEFDVQYPTGFLNIDFMNGQRINVEDLENGRFFQYDSVGIVDGSINCFIGRSGCGKSTIIKQMAANIIRPFPNGMIIEDSIEGGITSRREEILTKFTPSQINERMVRRNAGVTAESFYKRIRAIYDLKTSDPDMYRYDTGLFDSRGNRIFKFQPTVYILDSLAMLMPKKVTEEEELSGQMSATAAAKTIAAIFRRIVPLIKAANVIVMIVNHITEKVEINAFTHTKSQNIYLKQNETCPGGVTPFYTYNNVFRLDDGDAKFVTDTLNLNGGSVVDVSLVKSRTNKAGRTVPMVFDQDNGFDPEFSMLLTLKKAGVINGSGAFLYLGDHSDKKFSQKNFKKLIYTDPEFRNIYYQESLKYLKTMLADHQEINDEYSGIDPASDMINMLRESEGLNNHS